MKPYFHAALALLLFFAVACLQEIDQPKPETKARAGVIDEQIFDQAETVEVEQAMHQLAAMQSFVDAGVPMPIKGTDSTANFRLRAWKTLAGQVVVDMSVAPDAMNSPTAQLNAISLALKFYGNCTITQGAFYHNLHPWMVNWQPVYLDNGSGDVAYVSYYSLTGMSVPSSVASGAYPPGICSIGYTGTIDSIVPQVMEFSKDGYNNYLVDFNFINP